ncbi:Calmodulin-like protein 4 [Halotydeus destructor]|nr:Calmodulin-like protein 4 [Halotydeus destructor]
MARHFREQDIDEFRDCFYLNTRSKGQVTDIEELKMVMRSLGMSPTIGEMEKYLKEKGGKLSFADFLDVMYTHSKKEKIPQEIQEAFYGSDINRNGQIHVRDLRHILCEWGEKLEPKLYEQLLREAGASGHFVNYHDFLRVICSPVPDY